MIEVNCLATDKTQYDPLEKNRVLNPFELCSLTSEISNE